MAKSKSSRQWLDRHVNDPYVKQAQVDGYRSRASYKLIEINQKDKLIRPGMRVVDLGSAPGGWSQVAGPWVGDKGRIIATDILPMDVLPYTDFIQGDFTEDSVLQQLLEVLKHEPVDVVISDMAPNLSGISSADQASAMYLVELALDMARQTLRPGGSFVTKIFHGEGYDAFLKELRNNFDKVSVRKPDASRARSSEVYLVAKGFRAQ